MANERGPVSSALAHPAFLIALTALLTGLLAPWITSRWEARDKRVEAHAVAAERELEVKSAIVDHIGTASASFLSAIEVGAIHSDAPDARVEYRALKKASLEIGSQLAAYLPQSLPVTRWRDYTYSLRNAYILLTSPAGRTRSRWLNNLNRFFDVPPKHFAGLCLNGEQTNRAARFARDLRALVLAFEKREEEVVSAVAASMTVLTGTPTPDVSVKRTHFSPSRPCDRPA
jgi:hypothetical protein